MEPCLIYNGFRSYGPSELWAVGVMGRRGRDLTPVYTVGMRPAAAPSQQNCLFVCV